MNLNLTTATRIGLNLLALTLFLLLMRVSRLAGYHAAEHQTVHAMERNETLVPEIVCRMPRWLCFRSFATWIR